MWQAPVLLSPIQAGNLPTALPSTWKQSLFPRIGEGKQSLFLNSSPSQQKSEEIEQKCPNIVRKKPEKVKNFWSEKLSRNCLLFAPSLPHWFEPGHFTVQNNPKIGFFCQFEDQEDPPKNAKSCLRGKLLNYLFFWGWGESKHIISAEISWFFCKFGSQTPSWGQKLSQKYLIISFFCFAVLLFFLSICLFTHTHTPSLSLLLLPYLWLLLTIFYLFLSACPSLSFCFLFLSLSLSISLFFSFSLFYIYPSTSLYWLYHPHCISVCPLSWYHSLCSFLSPPLCVSLPLCLKNDVSKK